MLHDNKILFAKMISKTSTKLSMPEETIEKDYYVTLFLEEIVKKIPNIVFKGGTSLSKCYGIIKRFSEDIDLNLAGNRKPTEGERKALKKGIVETCKELGLSLTNENETRSKRDFNKYIINYPIIFPTINVNPNLIVETAVFFRIYPHNTMTANSYIYDCLMDMGRNDLIDEYGLHQFKVETQSIERTLIDKCFALADYYLSDRVVSHSRHLYDIYKLMQQIKPDDNLKELAEVVRIERQSNKTCLSSADDVNLNEVLLDILSKDVFEEDYNTTTQAILFKGEKVSYFEATKGLKEVIKSGIFSKNQDPKALNLLNDLTDKNCETPMENNKESGRKPKFDMTDD